MAIVRVLLLVIGIVFVMMGLLWIGQGSGIIRWPASSFMIDVSGWTIRGAFLALFGLALIWLSRRAARSR